MIYSEFQLPFFRSHTHTYTHTHTHTYIHTHTHTHTQTHTCTHTNAHTQTHIHTYTHIHTHTHTHTQRSIRSDGLFSIFKHNIATIHVFNKKQELESTADEEEDTYIQRIHTKQELDSTALCIGVRVAVSGGDFGGRGCGGECMRHAKVLYTVTLFSKYTRALTFVCGGGCM